MMHKGEEETILEQNDIGIFEILNLCNVSVSTCYVYDHHLTI